MESFAKGDRVSLKERLGTIGPEEFGIVVEVYRDNPAPIGAVVGTKDFENHGTTPLFDYGVLFTSLRKNMDESFGPWITDDVDLSQFDTLIKGMPTCIVPLAHDELNFIDSELREVLAEVLP